MMKRPTKWAAMRVCVLGVLLPWIVPIQWHGNDTPVPTGAQPTRPELVASSVSLAPLDYNVSDGEMP